MATRLFLTLLLLRLDGQEAYHLLAGTRRRAVRRADASMLLLTCTAPQPASLPSGSSTRTAVLAPPAPISAPAGAPVVDEAAAALLYAKAKELEQRKQFRQALAQLKKLSALTPADGRVWIKMMNAHLRAGRQRRAEEVVREGVEACPSNARLRQALADLCRRSRRYDEARTHFRHAMQLDESLGSVYDSWGRMEASLGASRAAIGLFQRGLALRPTARLHHALGVALDTEGQTEQAREVLQAGLKLPEEEGNPQLLHALGMLEARAGRTGRARALFGEAMERHPSFTATHLSLGRLEESMGRSEAARRAYHLGATAPQAGAQRGAVQLWQAWVRLEVKLGRRGQALRLYERACKLFPDDAQLGLGHAKLHADMGYSERARLLFARELARKRPHAYAFQAAAALEARDGDADAARALYERGAALPAAQPHARAALIRLLHAWAVFEWKSERPHAARALFERAQRTDEGLSEHVRLPARPFFLMQRDEDHGQRCSWLFQWRARFEAEQDNQHLARHYYARAVNVAPRDGSVWRMWSELEAELGEAERAALYAQRAQDLDMQESLNAAAIRSTNPHPLHAHAH